MVMPIDQAVAKALSSQLGCHPATQLPCTEEPFYLGQANGIVVLYNSSQQRRMYLPMSSIVLHVSNCRTVLSKDFACRDRFRP
jgi:hypothetical protein